MRIIETVFPIQVPQQPRVFTLEVDEDEMDLLSLGLRTHAWAFPNTEEEASALACMVEDALD